MIKFIAVVAERTVLYRIQSQSVSRLAHISSGVSWLPDKTSREEEGRDRFSVVVSEHINLY